MIELLSEVQTDWKDNVAISFVNYLMSFSEEGVFTESHIQQLLERNFDEGLLLFRLVLVQSKDEFGKTLKALFYNNAKGSGKNGFKSDPEGYAKKLAESGLLDAMNNLKSRTYTWKDIVQERLMMGRGSAIKGQTRGKNLEDFVEQLVSNVFEKYEVRKSFVGATGLSTAKADFCIPSTKHPSIVIEVKAYGATGSKQSDVIGDASKIIEEKRDDTYFILVTDGVTWTDRLKDFQRLIDFQNLGKIYRIYTQRMREDLLADLQQLKQELGL
ncbi:MAG: hypothetical protein HWE22_02765 [Flavobacteriales bacterium]|nr:hypothetical protein [Flavobacteriales bacterium]